MPFRTIPLILAGAALSACGGSEQAEPAQNDAVRLQEQIEKQANQIGAETENGTVAIERALENEGAVIFENRENLLNQAGNEASAAPPQG